MPRRASDVSALFTAAPSSPTAAAPGSGDLLGAPKYSCAASSRLPPFQRHQALIAAHIRTLIDGHGEMAFSQQLAESSPP